MPIDGLSMRDGALRRLACGPRFLLASIPLAALCFGAVGYLVVGHATDRIVRADALATAQGWSAQFIQPFDEMDSLLATGEVTAGQKSFFTASERQGQIIRFRLFDVHGRLVMASDEVAAAPADIALRDHDPHAVKVINGGREIVRLIGNANEAAHPVVLAEAYVPLRDGLGELRGIVAVSVDETAMAESVSSALLWAGAALGALMALAIGTSAAVIAYGRRSKRHALDAGAIDTDRAPMNASLTALGEELETALRQLNDAKTRQSTTEKNVPLGQLPVIDPRNLHSPQAVAQTSALLLESKTGDKRNGIEPQSIALDDWIARLVEEEAERLPQTMEIECRLGLGDSIAFFDPDRLNHVLVKLLVNAAETFAGRGGEAARGSVEVPRITVSTRITGRGVEIAVANNGPGMPSDQLGNIFEPLFTAKSDETDLGLPAALKIMEQHGGGIDVQSHPGQGAVLTAWWPIETRMKEAS
ncbi:ATP-binding protein [Aestuariivirga sp.]|uniref:ATP-binding protein n=1 Tax=Aestuariivirga sp. TaxID=2650926 RepID=UPI0035940D42